MADVQLSTLGSVIKTAYEGEANTNAFTDAEQTKLTGIETSADVTDATNVEAAGALMSSNNLNDIGDASTALGNLSGMGTSGGTFTGLVNFSGTNHPGIRLVSLTTTQRDALTAAAGDLIYNSTSGTVEGYNGSAWQNALAGASGGISNVVEDTTPQLGGHFDLNGCAICILCENDTGSAMALGDVVYISGFGTSHPEITLADADASGASPAFGVVVEAIADGSSGNVAILGEVSGLDTSSYAVNAILYLSATAGDFTDTQPSTGDTQPVARVLRSHASLGEILLFPREAGRPVRDDASIDDVNDNEALVFGVVSSAVNEIKVSNAATGNNPSISAQGDDTNVGIDFSLKGTGAASFDGPVQFSGTDHEGLRLNSLTTTQRDTLTAVSGMVIYNSTTSNIEGYDGSAWVDLTAAGGGSLVTTGTPVANDFARFTDASTVEGRSYAEVRSDLSLEIGTDVQAYDAGLDSIAGLTTAADRMIYTTGSDTYAVATLTSAGRAILDDASASDQRTTLGLGALAVLATVDTAQIDNESITEAKLDAVDSPADGEVLSYQSSSGRFEWIGTAGGFTSFTLAGDSGGGRSITNGNTATIAGGTGISTVDSDTDTVTINADSASTTAVGVVELTTTAEVDTGTDTARAITADALAGSVFGTKEVQLLVFDDSEDVVTGDGAGDLFFRVPSTYDGMNLVAVAASHQTAGAGTGTETTDIQIHNVTNAVDMLSTALTIDEDETDSSTAATAAAINASNDDVSTGDQLRIDVDGVTSTPPKGLLVDLQFRLP